MIIVIVNKEYDKITNNYKLLVSHGIDSETLNAVVLPQVHPSELGAVLNCAIGEYVIK